MPYTTLTPRLVCADVDAEIAFLQQVFDAEPGMRIATPDGQVVHAEVRVAGLVMSLSQSDGSTNTSPSDLGGSTVILTLMSEDPDDVARRAEEAGATIVFEVADRYYGMRDGRIRDPQGHLWIVSKTLQHMDEDELNERTARQM